MDHQGDLLAPNFSLVPADLAPPASQDLVNDFLQRIRPEWQSRSLIERVRRILPVDPSSACQRLLNAAIYDLREKIVIAGIDIAAQVAVDNRLPEPKRAEDVLESMNVQNVIDLSYRMGLLTRPEWRRMRRVYDIRRDLEHEDAEYEATPEDCFYVFATCIDVVLARDPVQLLRVQDIKDLVEAPNHVVMTMQYRQDYASAPSTRQIEILRYLLSTALDDGNAELIRGNAEEAIRALESATARATKIEIAKFLVERIGRQPQARHMRVAAAVGVIGLLPSAQVEAYFGRLAERFRSTSYRWTAWQLHAALLDELQDAGGLRACPGAVLEGVVTWMVLCYIGEPGRKGTFGRNRMVFYSNVAAPVVAQIIRDAPAIARDYVASARNSAAAAAGLRDAWVARRYEGLLDLVELAEQAPAGVSSEAAK